MTDGSSQGLFVVVAVVIFGIFVAISYSLFRDQLTPSLASIFQESTTMPTTFYLPDTPKGKEYTGSGEGSNPTPGFEEFFRVKDVDLSKLGDNYHNDTIYEITFYIKGLENGNVRIYTRSSTEMQYAMLFENNNYTSNTTIFVEGNEDFKKVSLNFKLDDSYATHSTSYLSFYSGYGTKNKVTVKDISISRVGTLK